MDNNTHILTSTLRKDTSFMALLATAKNTIFTIGEISKPLKDFSPAEQFIFISRTRRQLTHITKEYNRNVEETESEYQRSDKSPEADYRRAQRKGEIERIWSEVKRETQVLWSDRDYAGLMAILAEGSAIQVEIDMNALDEAAGFRVSFKECTIESVDERLVKLDVITMLETFGPVVPEELVITRDKILQVTFTTLEGKQRCMEAGRHVILGMPYTQTAHVFIDASAPFSLYIDGLPATAIDEDVRLALAQQDVIVSSVRMIEMAAVVGIEEEETFWRGIRLRRITIKGRTVNVVAGRGNDPDELKGIIGFWQGRTTHMNRLYAYIDAHEEWDVAYVQPAFWANGALKHYYFVKFCTAAAREKAMAHPLQIQAEVLQVHEIERDTQGRLSLPVEGMWRKRTRRDNTPQVATPSQTNQAPTFTLRQFN